MAEEHRVDAGAPPIPETRWTCEACGCHTNTEAANPSNCNICGTSRRGPTWLSGGSDPSASARRLMMRLELFGRRDEPRYGESRFSFRDSIGDELFEDFDGMDDDVDEDEEGEEGIPSHNFDEDASPHFSFNRDDGPYFDQHIADALSSAGITDAAFAVRDLVLARRSNSGPPSNTTETVPRRSPRLQLMRQGDHESETVSILTLAEENAEEFNPLWARNNGAMPLSSNSRHQPLPKFYADAFTGGPSHIHIITKGERVVRSNLHVPVTNKVHGFRFAMDNLVTQGDNMKRRYIIGVAPSPSSFHISDGSIGLGPFWGIDDTGLVIESRIDFIQSILNQGDQNFVLSASEGNTLVGRRISNPNNTKSSSDGSAVSPSDRDHNRRLVDRRSTGSTSNANDSLVVIIDNTSRLLSFFKDGVKIGSTTKVFPVSVSLYPVALLYETGSLVAITGLKHDPISIIRDFKEKLLRKKQRRLEERRQQITEQRTRLIHDGQPKPELEEVLRSIFSWYVQDENSVDRNTLSAISAARLWYRCGLKLSQLHELIESESVKSMDSYQSFRVTCSHFFSAVCAVLSSESAAQDFESFEIGDEVEVVEDYDLQPVTNNKNVYNAGDHVTIIDIRYEGDLRLLKIKSGDRRPSWIESSYVYSEKSGVIESTCLRCLKNVLRRHGYNPVTLQSRVGNCLSDANWKAGDLVLALNSKSQDLSLNMIGRVCESVKSSSNFQSSTSKVTVEFYDSVGARSCGTLAPSQRIISGLLNSMSLTNCTPSVLAYAGLKSGLFNKIPSLNDGSLFEDVEDGESNESKVHISLASNVTAVSKLDSSAITSLRSLMLEDRSIISKLSSQGLLDSILYALDKVYTVFVTPRGCDSNKQNVDVFILRALLQLIFMICQTIFVDPKINQCQGETIEMKSTPIDNLDKRKFIKQTHLRGKDHPPCEEAYSSTQDEDRLSALIERGLLCNDTRWVSKAVNTPNHRSSSSDIKLLLHDSDGDSLLYLAISFGCSMTILKRLIKAGCTVTNRDIKIAAVTGQTDALLLLLRYSTYKDESLDLNMCPSGIRNILVDAVSRQQKELSYLEEMGKSFTSKALSKMFQILYAIYDEESRRNRLSSTTQEIAKLLQGALFGNISSSEEPFNAKMLKDSPVSPRIGKGKVLQGSAFFLLIPEKLISDAILLGSDLECDSTSPLRNCMNILQSFLCTKNRQDNYAGFVLACHIFSSGMDLSTVNLDAYGFQDLLLLHKNRIEKECKLDISSAAGVVRCPQGHQAVYHVTEKSSFRCDLCDRAIKIGKGLYGCRICDWDACELCLKDDENRADATRINSMVVKACQACTQYNSGRATVLKLDHETKKIVKGIRNMDRDSLRSLAVRLKSVDEVPLHAFAKVFLPVIYSAVLSCLESRRHATAPLQTYNRVSRRKKPRVDSDLVETTSDDFLEILIEEMILPACAKGALDRSGISACLLRDESGDNDEDDLSADIPIFSDQLSVPPLIRMMHRVITIFEECSVSRYMCSKQFELESLSIPFTLELSFVPSAGHEIVRSIIAEPTVSLSDIRKRIIETFPSIDSKYLAYCERLPSSHIIIADKTANDEWMIARVIDFDTSTGNHIITYLDQMRGTSGSLTTLAGMFRFKEQKHSINLSSQNYFLIDEKQLWIEDFMENFSFTDITSMEGKDCVVLKRSWSALTLTEESPSTLSTIIDLDTATGRKIQVSALDYVLDTCSILFPPKISIHISLGQSLVSYPLEPLCDETLFSLFHSLTKKDSINLQDIFVERRARVILNVTWSPLVVASRTSVEEPSFKVVSQPAQMCEGLNDVSLTVLHLLSIIHSQLQRGSKRKRIQIPPNVLSFFEVDSLNQKLLNQLNDPLAVVCKSMPYWCTTCPCLFPMVFSHKIRRLLLERAFFGVSRSTIRQQEAKVSVSGLRTQMARLRSRAVELVAEAFSGGADPTALQHQADELYSLEEAIKVKISSVFAGQRWQERSLKRTRAVVCRDSIISDATKVMSSFVSDQGAKMRRLEVRFTGESGFDASDDEAGVTRGFYADLAEAFLKFCAFSQSPTDLSKQSSCPGVCPPSPVSLMNVHLWIADTDPSQKTIIPTPRADPSSSLGVYPRPMLPNDPRLERVLPFFKCLGRVFASAMRDHFIFPLPLSSTFLKLVLGGPKCHIKSIVSATTCQDSQLCDDIADIIDDRFILDSFDLPRPGFLGGEIFAAEEISKRLYQLEHTAHLLTKDEYEKRKNALASDRTFATKIMGASFEGSFIDYFEGKRFVDPFDPAQDSSSACLCFEGYNKPVTIDNIHDWVVMAKNFVLRDGVLAQAMAFRDGVNDLFSVDSLLLFSPEELQQDVCGDGDNVNDWDEKAIRSLLKLDVYESSETDGEIGNEDGLIRRFSNKSSTILYLVRTLLDAKVIARRQFLSFVTSLPICTPGKIEVVPIIGPSGEFLSVSERCLPRANTCGRRLYLPFFKSYEEFQNIFWSVVSEECKFKGFFEWRG